MGRIIALDASAPVSERISHHFQRRSALVVLTLCALGLGLVLEPGIGSAKVEPDLARLLRFMALLKGSFAVIAFGVCYWRLARPAALWRELVYVGGPGLMASAASCLWQLQSPGLASASLHIGMFALLAAALTDGAFIRTRRSPSV